MAKTYKITIIGSGNVAWQLALALESAGHVIQEVYSKHMEHAQPLAEKLYNAIPQDHLDFSKSSAKIFIIAIKDTAIAEVAKKLKLPTECCIAHTSGNIPLEPLKIYENCAVFYPLQTFTKSKKVDFKNIPICLEANNDKTYSILSHVAESLGASIHDLDSEKRKAVHLAAVFACNFTNHLLGIADYILNTQQIPSSILHPLIAETINKALIQNPFSAQTGPAVRNEKQVIEDHLEMLENIPAYQLIYESITNSIIDQHNSE